MNRTLPKYGSYVEYYYIKDASEWLSTVGFSGGWILLAFAIIMAGLIGMMVIIGCTNPRAIDC